MCPWPSLGYSSHSYLPDVYSLSLCPWPYTDCPELNHNSGLSQVKSWKAPCIRVHWRITESAFRVNVPKQAFQLSSCQALPDAGSRETGISVPPPQGQASGSICGQLMGLLTCVSHHVCTSVQKSLSLGYTYSLKTNFCAVGKVLGPHQARPVHSLCAHTLATRFITDRRSSK